MVSDDTCRPFSKNRSGLVIGEGAAVLALEEWEHARARGAADPRRGPRLRHERRRGRCGGAGPATAASARCAPRSRTPGANPEDIDYINAHGTATMLNDATETKAIRGVFGAHADRLAISSNKGVLGHSLGAAGALEAVATVLTLGDAGRPADRELPGAGPGLRPRRDPQRGPRHADRDGDVELLRLRRPQRRPGDGQGLTFVRPFPAESSFPLAEASSSPAPAWRVPRVQARRPTPPFARISLHRQAVDLSDNSRCL